MTRPDDSTTHSGPRFAQLAGPALTSRRRVVLALVVLVGGILATAATLIALLLGTGLGDLLVGGDSDPSGPIRPAELAITVLLVPVLALPAAVLTARWVLGMSVGDVCSVTGRFRWRWYVRCLLLSTGVVLAVSLLPLLWGGTVLGIGTEAVGGSGSLPPDWPWLLAIVLCCVPVQAFAEEFVFRGVLFQILGARWSRPLAAFAVPAITTSVLFSLVHAPAGWTPLLAYTVGGVCYALLCDRSGGLEASSAAHTVWNIALMTSVTLFAPTVDGATDLGTGTVPASAILPVVATDVVLASVLILLAHKARVTTRAGRTHGDDRSAPIGVP